MGFIRRGTGVVGGGAGGVDGLYTPSTINDIALRVRGLAGQVAQLFGVYDSANALLAGFESDGDIFAPDGIFNWNDPDEFRVTDFYADYQDNGVKYDAQRDFPVFEGNADKQFNVGQVLSDIAGTGAKTFAGITITNSGADITIGAGTGQIVDLSADRFYALTWAEITGESIADDNTFTYLFIDSAGALVKQTTAPTAANLRDMIYLGKVLRIGGTIVSVFSEPKIYMQPSNQLYDLFRKIGIINASGNVLSANGANLRIDKSAGSLLALGSNFNSSADNPHEVSIALATAATFQYRSQSASSSGSDTQDIVPGNYDNAGTVTAIPGSNDRATIQRVFLFPNGNIRVQYGQAIYSSIAAAISAINSEDFVDNPNISDKAIFIGAIVVRKGATDLSDSADARIFVADKFGKISGGSSASTLQEGYDNSLDGNVTVDAARGAVKIRDASTAIGAALLEVLSNDGTTAYLRVNATGIIAGGDNAIFNANRLQGRNVGNTAPVDGQLLTWVAANTRWEPATINSRVTFVANQNIAANGQAAPNLQASIMALRVTGDAGAQTMNNVPLNAAVSGGTIIIFLGQDSTNTVRVPSADVAGGFLLNGSCTLRDKSILAVAYDASIDRYVELFRSE